MNIYTAIRCGSVAIALNVAAYGCAAPIGSEAEGVATDLQGENLTPAPKATLPVVCHMSAEPPDAAADWEPSERCTVVVLDKRAIQ